MIDFCKLSFFSGSLAQTALIAGRDVDYADLGQVLDLDTLLTLNVSDARAFNFHNCLRFEVDRCVCHDCRPPCRRLDQHESGESDDSDSEANNSEAEPNGVSEGDSDGSSDETNSCFSSEYEPFFTDSDGDEDNCGVPYCRDCHFGLNHDLGVD